MASSFYNPDLLDEFLVFFKDIIWDHFWSDCFQFSRAYLLNIRIISLRPSISYHEGQTHMIFFRNSN